MKPSPPPKISTHYPPSRMDICTYQVDRASVSFCLFTSQRKCWRSILTQMLCIDLNVVLFFPHKFLFCLFQPNLVYNQHNRGLLNSSMAVGCCQDSNESDSAQGGVFKKTFLFYHCFWKTNEQPGWPRTLTGYLLCKTKLKEVDLGFKIVWLAKASCCQSIIFGLPRILP